jgi:hypothetical protein
MDQLGRSVSRCDTCELEAKPPAIAEEEAPQVEHQRGTQHVECQGKQFGAQFEYRGPEVGEQE